jgi:FAD:protein FMN transferase
VNSPPISKQSSRNSVTASACEAAARSTALERKDGAWRGRFRAMASPCEVLIEGPDGGRLEAQALLDAIAAEAWRVEDKYSRYRAGNVVHAINTSAGAETAVDEETADLLDFAERLFVLSDGLFDITSGVLRRAWKFDGGSRVPAEEEVAAVRELVGWRRVHWSRPSLKMPRGMEIDFGGVCKEYAVDRAAACARQQYPGSCLVNLGGDLAVSRPRASELAWRVGIEAPGAGAAAPVTMIDVRQGAVATSGDTYLFVMRDGRRYTHILDPRTGWPVRDAPRSVTVAAGTCTQAGMLTTLAVLQGAGAESFLKQTGVKFWIAAP